METTRIKWDESMAVRCLSRCPDHYVKEEKPVIKEKEKEKASDKIEINLEPAATEVKKPKTVTKKQAAKAAAGSKASLEDIQWNDFKKALDNAID